MNKAIKFEPALLKGSGYSVALRNDNMKIRSRFIFQSTLGFGLVLVLDYD